MKWVHSTFLAFYSLTCAITWIVLIPQTASSRGLLPFQTPPIFVVVAAFGPTLSAIVLTALIGGGKSGLRGLLSGLLVWRVGIRWYVFALFSMPLIGLCTIALQRLLDGPTAADIAAPFPWYLLLPAFLTYLLTAPLGEEIGWRGYALPHLQARSNALVASLVLGMLWGFWHLPLFWIPGKFSDLPFGWFLLGILPLSVLFTWVFNNTKGSILIAVLFHGEANFAFLFFPILPAETGELGPFKWYVGLLWIVAIIVLVVEGPARLSRRSLPPEALGRVQPPSR